jgi:asparagine synthase (glutamine-hydrolysing)
MCGINGFNFQSEDRLKDMNQALLHRGPDFQGIFVDENVSISHNLLSIRAGADISQQPYKLNPKWIMSFNGQIYNLEKIIKYLRERNVELDDYKLDLDTYVIYKLIELEGDKFINKIFGMFAIALYDTEDKMLRLYRDSSGQKNLHYHHKDDTFIFSSEISGILTHDIDRTVDEQAVQIATTLGYIPGDKTLMKYVKKINPSEVIEISLNKESINYNKLIRKYFKPESQNYFTGNFEEAMNQLVSEHLQSKDKVSINLSGGLDSSILLHEARKQGYQIDSYTNYFEIDGDEKSYNEDAYLARKLAKDYDTKHTEIKITKQNYLENLIQAYEAIEEPNYNISLPAYLITAKTEGISGDGLRVVLSGDGGDEVFGGYSYYLQNKLIDDKVKLYTPFIYEAIRYIRAKLSGKEYISNLQVSTRWLYFKDLKKRFINNYDQKMIINYLAQIYKDYTNNFQIKKDSVYECMLADRVFWLASENFIRSDKLYMSQSMELRNPFSYEPFRDYCDRLVPSNEYINTTNNKIFLRHYADGKLPDYITKREKKTGWRAPVETWYDENYKNLFLEILNKAKNNQKDNLNKSEDGEIIKWDEVIKRVEERDVWPGKWVHIYLSLAILSNKFDLKM